MENDYTGFNTERSTAFGNPSPSRGASERQKRKLGKSPHDILVEACHKKIPRVVLIRPHSMPEDLSKMKISPTVEEKQRLIQGIEKQREDMGTKIEQQRQLDWKELIDGTIDTITTEDKNLFYKLASILQDKKSRCQFVLSRTDEADAFRHLAKQIEDELDSKDVKNSALLKSRILEGIFSNTYGIEFSWKELCRWLPDKNKSFIETQKFNNASVHALCRAYLNFATNQQIKTYSIFISNEPECHTWLKMLANHTAIGLEKVFTELSSNEIKFLKFLLDSISYLFSVDTENQLKWRNMGDKYIGPAINLDEECESVGQMAQIEPAINLDEECESVGQMAQILLSSLNAIEKIYKFGMGSRFTPEGRQAEYVKAKDSMIRIAGAIKTIHQFVNGKEELFTEKENDYEQTKKLFDALASDIQKGIQNFNKGCNQTACIAVQPCVVYELRMIFDNIPGYKTASKRRISSKSARSRHEGV